MPRGRRFTRGPTRRFTGKRRRFGSGRPLKYRAGQTDPDVTALSDVVIQARKLLGKLEGLKRYTQMMMSSARGHQHVQKAVRQAISAFQETATGLEHVVFIAEEALDDIM